MKSWLNRLSLFGFIACAGMTLAGCGRGDGPELGQVIGRVMLDGKPLSGATVQFQPEQGRSSFGQTDADGRYEMEYLPGSPGAVVGTHVVRITTENEVTVGEATLDTGEGKSSGGAVTRLVPERLPPTYNVESTLKEQVEPGANEINFDLKSKP